MFDAAEIRTLLKQCDSPSLRGMAPSGINCGLGNADVGRLPKTAVDLAAGWLDFPRPKTAVARRAPLWDETVEALEKTLATMPKVKADADKALVFITKHGRAWSNDSGHDPVSEEFAKLQKRVGTYRPGRGFYCLRRTFQTIGDEARDPIATRVIMGHAEDPAEHKDGDHV